MIDPGGRADSSHGVFLENQCNGHKFSECILALTYWKNNYRYSRDASLLSREECRRSGKEWERRKTAVAERQTTNYVRPSLSYVGLVA